MIVRDGAYAKNVKVNIKILTCFREIFMLLRGKIGCETEYYLFYLGNVYTRLCFVEAFFQIAFQFFEHTFLLSCVFSENIFSIWRAGALTRHNVQCAVRAPRLQRYDRLNFLRRSWRVVRGCAMFRRSVSLWFCDSNLFSFAHVLSDFFRCQHSCPYSD